MSLNKVKNGFYMMAESQSRVPNISRIMISKPFGLQLLPTSGALSEEVMYLGLSQEQEMGIIFHL